MSGHGARNRDQDRCLKPTLYIISALPGRTFTNSTLQLDLIPTRRRVWIDHREQRLAESGNPRLLGEVRHLYVLVGDGEPPAMQHGELGTWDAATRWLLPRVHGRRAMRVAVQGVADEQVFERLLLLPECHELPDPV